MSFGNNVLKWCQKEGISLEDASKAIRIQVSKGTILRTPVDTGRARGSWVSTLGNPSDDLPEIDDKPGQISISEAQKVADKKPDGIFYLTNNLPYIRKLEYEPIGSGGSVQSPNGMVRITLQELKEGIKNLVKNV